MARDMKTSVGSGITERTKTSVHYDLRDPNDVQQFLEASESMNDHLETLWGSSGRILDAVLDRLAEIKASLPNPHDDIHAINAAFAERETEAWYLNQISIEKKVAEGAMQDGNPFETMQAALRIGELLAELRLKGLWEPAALVGAASLTGSKQGGRMRAAQFAARHDEIRAYYAERLARLNNDKSAKNATAKTFNISRRHLNRILIK